jgi:HD-GYP domain-containing protein (c-di-GMP phosphodiesterase class II)/ABC-type amino acid transport substrate-binding protein
MKFSFGKMHTTIRLTVVTVFIIATTLTAGVATGLQYYFGQSMAKKAASDLYASASSSIAAELRSVATINANIIDLLADNPGLSNPEKQAMQLDIFTRILRKNPLYYGVYLGREDGSFFEVINLDTSDKARRVLSALPTDRWVIITVQQGKNSTLRKYRYLDEKLVERVSRSEQTDFTVTSRPWYTNAMASDSVQSTDTYLFAQLGVPGRTISRRVTDTNTVVAIDMTLSAIAEFLSEHQISKHSDVYLYSGDGQITASSLEHQFAQPKLPVPQLVLTEEEKQFVASLPTLTVSNELNWPPFDYTQSGQPQGYSIDIIRMIAQMTGIQVRFINGYSWPELTGKFQSGEVDLLHSVVLTGDNAHWGLAGKSYAALPYSLVTRENSAALTDLTQLNGKSLAIPAGWSIIPLVRSRFPNVGIIEANSTLQAIELVMAGEADAALDNEIILRYIIRHYFLDGLEYHSNVDLGNGEVPDQLHILVSENQPRLRALLDKAITAIGVKQHEYLSETWLDFETKESSATSGVVPSRLLVEIAAKPELHGKLFETPVRNQTYLAYSAPTAAPDKHPLYVGILSPLDTVIDPFLDKVKLSILITVAFLLLLLPLSWIFANPIVYPIRQLATENDKVRRREYDEVTRIRSSVKELDELSESMVNMVASIQAHELAQRKLMDSFIQLIAQAIDDKSPYTGGHCERVPELALMLADHASHSELPAFRDFHLDTDDEWREYRIAAWLHDCGKITVPEHIVDKGSKLETIYNRIHEVRMRFEVLWRDAKINYWERLSKSPEEQETLAAELEAAQQQLRNDFSFVAECNVGGEFFDEEKQARLHHIAQITWQRHFDNRIGLSPVEELQTPPGEPVLPATEPLLSDKPEHIIERTRSTDYPPEFGINMDVPEHLYNQGELYNLSIARGTLTSEDRFKINEHMISTIKMLESLPFPEELKNVPRYASTHHETMRGSGYPRRLPGEQLSIPERILAVADVFEALTASDRPYKKAKPVSVAVDILHMMVLDKHLDKDCFELFIRDKVYLQYAQQFLSPGQIDEVYTAKYFSENS